MGLGKVTIQLQRPLESAFRTDEVAGEQVCPAQHMPRSDMCRQEVDSMSHTAEATGNLGAAATRCRVRSMLCRRPAHVRAHVRRLR
jgi:hypothetical protein